MADLLTDALEIGLKLAREKLGEVEEEQQMYGYSECHVLAAMKNVATIEAALSALSASTTRAGPTEEWLLSLMGKFDFTIPRLAFGQLVHRLATPPSAPAVAAGWDIKRSGDWIAYRRPDGWVQSVTPHEPMNAHSQTLYMLLDAMLAATPPIQQTDALDEPTAAPTDEQVRRLKTLLFRAQVERQVFADECDRLLAAAPPEAAVGVSSGWQDEIEQRIRTWRTQLMNQDGDQLAIDDFMDQESLDDLVDHVCAPLSAALPPHPAPTPAAMIKEENAIRDAELAEAFERGNQAVTLSPNMTPEERVRAWEYGASTHPQRPAPTDEFERGRQQGMQQERALWKLSMEGQAIERMDSPTDAGREALVAECKRLVRQMCVASRLAYPGDEAYDGPWAAMSSAIDRLAAPLQPAREPLTEDRIAELTQEAGFNTCLTPNMLFTVRGNHAQASNLVRLIEQAHGITAKPQPNQGSSGSVISKVTRDSDKSGGGAR